MDKMVNTWRLELLSCTTQTEKVENEGVSHLNLEQTVWRGKVSAVSHLLCESLTSLCVHAPTFFFPACCALHRHSLYPNGVFGKMAEVSNCTWWDFRWPHDLIPRIHLDSHSFFDTAVLSLCRCIIARDLHHFDRVRGSFCFALHFHLCILQK